jgi:hypothetical protein
LTATIARAKTPRRTQASSPRPWVAGRFSPVVTDLPPPGGGPLEHPGHHGRRCSCLPERGVEHEEGRGRQPERRRGRPPSWTGAGPSRPAMPGSRFRTDASSTPGGAGTSEAVVDGVRPKRPCSVQLRDLPFVCGDLELIRRSAERCLIRALLDAGEKVWSRRGPGR